MLLWLPMIRVCQLRILFAPVEVGGGRRGRTFPILAAVDVVNLEYLRKVLWSNVCDCGLAVKCDEEGKSEKRGIASSDFILAGKK